MINHSETGAQPRQQPPARGERLLDSALRPRSFDEYIGQNKLKTALGVFIDAAKKREEPLEHMLLSGPPGLGKTTLAMLIAKEAGASLKITSGPAIEKAADLAALLTNLQPGDVLFIDEIHRLHRTIEEILYPAMEDRALDILVGKGAGARSVRLDIAPCTIIGATTRPGLLSRPLRDRFGFSYRLGYYTDADMQKIVAQSAHMLDLTIEATAIAEIAARARATPRIANRLLKRVRDFSDVAGETTISHATTLHALDALEVDAAGLDEIDRKILLTLIEKFAGQPVGLSHLAAAISEETDTLEEVYEPFLIQKDFLARTPRGRIATATAYRHLGRKPPAGENETLV